MVDLQAAGSYALKPPPHFLVVLGMHRSGTSLVSQTLHTCGVSLGPVPAEQALIECDEVHWEGSTLTWINERLLNACGGTWDRPPADIRWSAKDAWRARRFLWSFAGARVASFKDPRACLTFPLWRSVLPSHSLVVCVRHPFNVARSLAARDGLTLDEGLRLWTHYNRALLKHLDGTTRIYGFQFDDGEQALCGLLRSIGRDHAIDATVNPVSTYRTASHHHREQPALPLEVSLVYDEVLERMHLARTPAPHTDAARPVSEVVSPVA